MAKLNVKFKSLGSVDGIYDVQAKGCSVAVLRWGDANGAWEDWTSFAYVPLHDGQGEFRLTGGRAIPPGATHIYARLIAEDFLSDSLICAEIPESQQTQPFGDALTFCAMSDLHLYSRTEHIKHALQSANKADALLLAGDQVNDGIGEQLHMFRELLRDNVRVPVFAVAGNHDIPKQGSESYSFAELQAELLAETGVSVMRDTSGAYAAHVGITEIIGVQCVTEGRKFLFPDGQFEWLDQHIQTPSDAAWRIILCHAPLLRNNPQRKDGSPYHNREIRLRRIMDANTNLILLSGHIHNSPNDPRGGVEWDVEHGNLYISDGSVCPTTSPSWRDTIVPEEWTKGVRVTLRLTASHAEIRYDTLYGKHISRGYYRVKKEKTK